MMTSIVHLFHPFNHLFCQWTPVMQHRDDSVYMHSSIYVHLRSASFFIQTQFHSVRARTRNRGTERERESSLYYCFVYVSICVIEY
jgi:hypothetical protein